MNSLLSFSCAAQGRSRRRQTFTDEPGSIYSCPLPETRRAK
ncbi:hypothetical protein [uncultured Akkermansia sp.]|nr:hypothetical protein [uncultured Akkermansia sp.]